MALVLKSLNAATADMNGDALELNEPTARYSAQYTVASVSGTVHIHLEGSLDGVNFFSQSNQVLSGLGTFTLDANGPLAVFIRARLEVGGGSANVTAYVAAKGAGD